MLDCLVLDEASSVAIILAQLLVNLQTLLLILEGVVLGLVALESILLLPGTSRRTKLFLWKTTISSIADEYRASILAEKKIDLVLPTHAILFLILSVFVHSKRKLNKFLFDVMHLFNCLYCKTLNSFDVCKIID